MPVLPFQCPAKTIKHFTVGVCVCVCGLGICLPRGKLSSPDLNKLRHHSVGARSICYCLSGHISASLHIYNLCVCRTRSSFSPHPVARLGWQLLCPESNERRKSPKRPQPRPAHCYYPAQAFLFLLRSAPIKNAQGLEERQLPGGRCVIIQSKDKRVRGK